MYDIIVIGAGPAGVTAGIYAKRANVKTMIIYDEKSSLEKTEKIDNYYGFENGISGGELYASGINQAKNLGVETIKEEVLKIEIEKDLLLITTTNNKYTTRALILATGIKKNSPKIKGIKEFEGKGISYCAVCDGFFYKNKNVAVLGNGDYAISEINDLINITNKITILTNGKKSPEIRAENIKINQKEIKQIKGKDKVEEIEFIDNTKMNIDGIFIAEGTAGALDFAKKLGILTNQNAIIVNNNMETNIPKIYACGDCTGGLYQISKAIYEGTKAALSAIEKIKINKEIIQM